jgi:magnesium chelatase subunit D
VDVTQRVATALACSALDPSLPGLLLLDLEPALIYPLARWLKELLEDDDPPLIQLGPMMAEDTLWERFKLHSDRRERPEDLGFRWEPGRLAGYGRPPGIVVVPDLAWLGLPAARAAVTLIDADVAHLERSGVTQTWRPRDRWLAALRRDEVHLVSAHLLDRFAVRVDARTLEVPWNPAPDTDTELPWNPDPALFQTVRERLGNPLPGISVAAVNRVVAKVSPSGPGSRRDLALGRLARALAALTGDPAVLPGHVDRAAELVGLRPSPGRRGTYGDSRNGSGNRHDEYDDGRAAPGPLGPHGVNGQLPVESDIAERAMPLLPHGPYPEDTAKPGRDAPLLRVGWQRVLTGPPRGQPIGTQRALDDRDIAVTATVLNAARFQRLRCPEHNEHYQLGHELHVANQDLLGYRRAPQPGQLLVLLLDHTCRARDWDWYEPLSQYLGWAYVTRALVGVVEVGAAADETTRDLRATQFQSRGVLDPRVAAALGREPGRATPLAHGLSLAFALLRRSTQQGGPAISEAVLVVVTDGRANVPLPHSQTGTVPANVGRAGVDHALREARKIKALGRRVRSVVIDPGWQLNGHLAAMLAAELAAPLEHGTAAAALRPPGLEPDWPEPASGAA